MTSGRWHLRASLGAEKHNLSRFLYHRGGSIITVGGPDLGFETEIDLTGHETLDSKGGLDPSDI